MVGAALALSTMKIKSLKNLRFQVGVNGLRCNQSVFSKVHKPGFYAVKIITNKITVSNGSAVEVKDMRVMVNSWFGGRNKIDVEIKNGIKVNVKGEVVANIAKTRVFSNRKSRVVAENNINEVTSSMGLGMDMLKKI